ncbi:hypothetical protein GCM10023310_53850 [Paenibacillus vulneris]
MTWKRMDEAVKKVLLYEENPGESLKPLYGSKKAGGSRAVGLDGSAEGSRRRRGLVDKKKTSEGSENVNKSAHIGG